MIGCGPAGATTARLLSMWGYRVVVVDKSARKPNKFNEVLPPSAASLVGTLQLSNLFAAESGMAIRCSGVSSDWEQPNGSVDDYFTHPGGGGWVVKRRLFDENLKTLAIEAGVTYFDNCSLGNSKDEGSVWHLDLSAGNIIRVGFVIDASGRASVFARSAGAKRITQSRLLAGGTTLPPAAVPSPSSVMLSIKSATSGWAYSVANALGEVSTVLISPRKEIANRVELKRELMEVFPEYQDPIHCSESFSVVDASSTVLTSIAGARWLAIGDAAASYDPITSQGLANSLSTALMGAHACREFLSGNSHALFAYEESVFVTWERSERGRSHFYSRYASRKIFRAGYGVTSRVY